MRFTKLISGIKKVAFFSLGMTIWHSVGIAADYYVSPTGSASWPSCTNINTPCSLNTGANNAVAGDTVYLRGGTYSLPLQPDGKRDQAGLMPANSGTSGNPITFKAYAGETPFLDNSVNTDNDYEVASFGVNGQDYIVFDGLHTTALLMTSGSSHQGMSRGGFLQKTKGSVIRNCVIEGESGGTSNNTPIFVEAASYCTIENNILYGAHQSGSSHHNSAGFMLYRSDHITVQNNTIYDCDTALFDKEGGTYNVYRYNFMYNVWRPFQHSSISSSTGNLEIYQNIFINISSWAFQNAGGDNDPARDILFYNNTIYNSGNGAHISSGNESASTDVTGFEHFNNIYHTITHEAVELELEEVEITDYNKYYNVAKWNIGSYDGTNYHSLSSWQSATGDEASSSTSDPNFVNAGGTSPEDYKRTSYPQDGRGGNYPSVIGAYITGNEVIGYNGEGAVTPPPPPPPSPIGTPQGFNIVTVQ